MRSSKTLGDILSCQRSYSNKTRLDYDKGIKSKHLSPIIQYGNKKIYAGVLKDPIKKEDSQKYNSCQNRKRTNKMIRRPVTNKSMQLVLVNCYVCKKFGHKSFNCRMNHIHN